jgi:hypothetical protein
LNIAKIMAPKYVPTSKPKFDRDIITEKRVASEPSGTSFDAITNIGIRNSLRTTGVKVASPSAT